MQGPPKHGKGDGFVANGGIAKTSKALLASVLTEEGGETNASNNQTVFRAGKTNTEWKLYLARIDDQEIRTSDDKMLCPDGIYLWLLKENNNYG